jgi:dUTPase
VQVRSGDRIAQGILLDAPRVAWVEAEPEKDSRGGFGSSG